jgi:hypothetical protein
VTASPRVSCVDHHRGSVEIALWHHSVVRHVVVLAAALALGAALAGCSSSAGVAQAPRSQSSPATATSGTSGAPVVLAGDGVAGVRFGESTSSAIAGLDRVLGKPPRGPVNEAGNCNIDAAEQWSGLTGFFDTGTFVGYSTLAANGERLTPGNMATAMGLRVGDTIVQARQIYGSAFQTSLAQGGSWSVITADGKFIGYLSGEPNQPGPSPAIMSIEAGSVGCPAATP